MILQTTPAAGVRVLTLNDPARMNALSGPLVSELAAAVADAEADSAISALVITGSGRGFCAGAVLGDLDALGNDPDGGASALSSIYEGFLCIERSPLLTIAAVNGPAVGAGLNLALACDIRVATKVATFDPRFLGIALHPGGGHTRLLHRAVGHQAAAAMLLAQEAVDGIRAAEIGLAWTCADDVVGAAIRLATQAAQSDRALLLRAKQSLRITPTLADHAEAVDYELEQQLWSIAQRVRRS
ncbi:MAG: enoyl-CoA hydratase-related protein [Acidimicrobiia bacterium]